MDEAKLARWHERIGRAADLLSTQLDDPPGLDALAAAAAVSPYHFHRIWRGLTGETVRQTIARLRIEAAQGELAAGASVTAAAMGAGFATSQSFARAFRRTTGRTPSQGGVAMVAPLAPIRLELRAPTAVIALRRTGGGYVELNALFQGVADWAGEAGVIDRLQGLYGIPYDDPAAVAPGRERYAACMDFGPVDPALLAGVAVEPLDLPGGRHAVLTHRGPYDALHPLTQWLVGEWLPRSGYEPADAPAYHHFHDDPEEVAEAELTSEVWLPLAD